MGRDLEQRIQAQLAPIGNPKWTNLREEYRQELTSQELGALIATELLYQKASTTGIKATEAEIQAEVSKFTKAFANDAEVNRALADRGTDRDGLHKELERSLVVSRFVQESVTKKITVTPEEVSQYYSSHTDEFRHPDMVRTSHILILVAEGATAEQEQLARRRAEAVLARARKGEDFAKLAKEYSMDNSASQGGDIGFTPKGQLAPEYEEAAFALDAGKISDPVRTQFGYHIIKVTAKKMAGLATLEESRTQLTEFLRNQKAQRELDKIVNELRAQAKIDLYIPAAMLQQGAGGAIVSSPRP